MKIDSGEDRLAAIDDDYNMDIVDISPVSRPLSEKRDIEDSGIVSSRGAVNLQSEPKGDHPSHRPIANDCMPRSNTVQPQKLSSGSSSPATNQTQGSTASLFRAKSFQGTITYVSPYANTIPPPMPTNESKAIAMLSYNFFMRPPGIRNNASDYKNARLTHFGEQIFKRYDLVGFQEVFSYGSSRQAKLASYAKKHGLEYCMTSPSKGLLNATIDGGLMICSRFPIVEGAKLTYKRGVHSDRFSAKGALYAKICVGTGHFIHVFNTHLQASYSFPVSPNDPSTIIRIQQLCMLKEFIDECTRNKASHEPIIIMGDLNINSRASAENGREHSQEYQLMNQILKGEITACHLFPQMISPEQQVIPIKSNISDILFTAMGEHPITFGDVMDFKNKAPKETALTSAEELGVCCSFDYILNLNHDNATEVNSSGRNLKKYEFDHRKTKIESFSVMDEPFTQLSGTTFLFPISPCPLLKLTPVIFRSLWSFHDLKFLVDSPTCRHRH